METELSADIAEADKQITKFLEAKQSDSAAIITQPMEEMATNKVKELKGT